MVFLPDTAHWIVFVQISPGFYGKDEGRTVSTEAGLTHHGAAFRYTSQERAVQEYEKFI